MSILHVTDFYLPRLGGIEMQVHDLASHMRRQGFQARVLTETPPAASTREAGAQADQPEPSWVTRVPGWKVSPRQRRKIDEALAEAEVVHCHTSLVSPLAWYVARRAAARGLPVVVTMHSMSESVPGAGFAFGAVFRGLGPVHWTAVSSVAAEVLEPLVRRQVEVLPNGIDPGDWRPRAEEHPGPVTLASVMRLAPRKRALPLVRILADVRSQVPAQIPIRAVIAGDGPQRERVERVAKRLDVDFLELRGRLDRPQIATLLAESHLFLAPATLESFGIAALEARSAGLPVVAMRVGGVSEFVGQGREGYLVDTDKDLAQAAARLLIDDDLRRRIRTHNCRHPTELGWDQGVGRAIALYRRLGATPSQVVSLPGETPRLAGPRRTQLAG